jgi:DivIVA domain-containing protein
VIRPQFSVQRTGDRYDRADVDAFVDRILATVSRLATRPVTVAELRTVEFGTPLFGAGYPAREVDEFLAEAEQWMPDRPAAGPTQRREAPRFSMVRIREGYDPLEVDEFVDRLIATVNGEPVERPVTPRDVRRVQFSPVRLHQGYDIVEVDQFLDEAEDWLRRG